MTGISHSSRIMTGISSGISHSSRTMTGTSSGISHSSRTTTGTSGSSLSRTTTSRQAQVQASMLPQQWLTISETVHPDTSSLPTAGQTATPLTAAGMLHRQLSETALSSSLSTETIQASTTMQALSTEPMISTASAIMRHLCRLSRTTALFLHSSPTQASPTAILGTR